jgi:hypothetical protein
MQGGDFRVDAVHKRFISVVEKNPSPSLRSHHEHVGEYQLTLMCILLYVGITESNLLYVEKWVMSSMIT